MGRDVELHDGVENGATCTCAPYNVYSMYFRRTTFRELFMNCGCIFAAFSEWRLNQTDGIHEKSSAPSVVFAADLPPLTQTHSMC